MAIEMSSCNTGCKIAKAKVSALELFVVPWPLFRDPESPEIQGEQDRCPQRCAGRPLLETAYIDWGTQPAAGFICLIYTKAPDLKIQNCLFLDTFLTVFFTKRK